MGDINNNKPKLKIEKLSPQQVPAQQKYKACIWDPKLIQLKFNKQPHLFARLFLWIFLGIRIRKNG